MTIEQLDPYWIALLFVTIGGILAVVIPYVCKVIDDPETSFNFSYFAALVIGMVFAAMALVPDPVPDLVGRQIALLIMAGYGIQSVANTATTRIGKL